MQKNKNALTIVMDREIFDELLQHAHGSYDPEFVALVQKHVRKFNAGYQTDEAERKANEAAALREKLMQARNFFKARQGRPTYVWTEEMGALRVTLRGVSKFDATILFRLHESEKERMYSVMTARGLDLHDQFMKRLSFKIAVGYDRPMSMSSRHPLSRFYSTAEAAEKDNKR